MLRIAEFKQTHAWSAFRHQCLMKTLEINLFALKKFSVLSWTCTRTRTNKISPPNWSSEEQCTIRNNSNSRKPRTEEFIHISLTEPTRANAQATTFRSFSHWNDWPPRSIFQPLPASENGIQPGRRGHEHNLFFLSIVVTGYIFFHQFIFHRQLFSSTCQPQCPMQYVVHVKKIFARPKSSNPDFTYAVYRASRVSVWIFLVELGFKNARIDRNVTFIIWVTSLLELDGTLQVGDVTATSPGQLQRRIRVSDSY